MAWPDSQQSVWKALRLANVTCLGRLWLLLNDGRCWLVLFSTCVLNRDDFRAETVIIGY